MINSIPNRNSFVEAIRDSGLTIYDKVQVGDPLLWIPAPELERLLDDGLHDLSVAGLPLRTRSKFIKQTICRILGYPVPVAFTKTKPQFPGQMFDSYTQKSNNLQIWNEKLTTTRRYVLVGVAGDVVSRVKVVTGDRLAILDTKGTLTKKYQARCVLGSDSTELITALDTLVIEPLVLQSVDLSLISAPIKNPQTSELLPISIIFEKLSILIGQSFIDAGIDQERNRGAALHRLVCAALGYHSFQDNGQFPDIRHQLLEVKLQTSQTIDLGLVRPDSVEPLDVPMIDGKQIRHCDVRYAIFYGNTNNSRVEITHLFLTTGEGFFNRFQQFQGLIMNAKLQIHLPTGFLERQSESLVNHVI